MSKGWHTAYRERVLEPDYTFACRHLSAYLLDALIAHVRTVKRLPDAFVQNRRHDIETLEHSLNAMRTETVAPYDPDVPDLYYAVNRRLEAQHGEELVGFLRLGLSRNDLDMTIYKMRARELLIQLGEQLSDVQGQVLKQAQDNLNTILVAYTHHQPGQPTTVAHYLSAIASTVGRDISRFRDAYDRLNTCPLGAAALAGSSHPLDRTYTATLLGFAGPVENTYDAVASSDWQVEFVGVAQSCALSLSRFVCDLLGWASQDIFRLSDRLVQGSSIMPQKRNPVALEHARTRLSRALGASQMVLYSSHNIPYGDLNDFGPDIQGALQALFLQLSGALALLTACLDEGRFNEARLAALAAGTDTTATELADELVRSYGFSFQRAHRLVADLVVRLGARAEGLRAVTPEDVAELGGPVLSGAELAEVLDATAFVARRNGLGGPAPSAVAAQLREREEQLAEDRKAFRAMREQLGRSREALVAGREIA